MGIRQIFRAAVVSVAVWSGLAAAELPKPANFRVCGVLHPFPMLWPTLQVQGGKTYFLEPRTPEIVALFQAVKKNGEPIPACVISPWEPLPTDFGTVILVEQYELGRGVTISSQ